MLGGVRCIGWGPKPKIQHILGMVPNFGVPVAILQNITIYYVFATSPETPQEDLEEVTIGNLGSHHVSYTSI